MAKDMNELYNIYSIERLSLTFKSDAAAIANKILGGALVVAFCDVIQMEAAVLIDRWIHPAQT